jgi:hypothetical protein
MDNLPLALKASNQSQCRKELSLNIFPLAIMLCDVKRKTFQQNNSCRLSQFILPPAICKTPRPMKSYHDVGLINDDKQKQIFLLLNQTRQNKNRFQISLLREAYLFNIYRTLKKLIVYISVD